MTGGWSSRPKLSRGIRIIGFGLVLLLAPASMHQSASAASGNIAVDIVDEFLGVADITSIDSGIRETLEQRVDDALNVGAIDVETLAELGFSVSAGETTSTLDGAPSTLRDHDRIRDRLHEHVREQSEIWAIISPEWREAFEPLRELLRTCRDSDEPACRNEYRTRLQYSHALRVEATYRERTQASIGQEPDTLRALEQQRLRAEERLREMINGGDPTLAEDGGVTVREMEQLRSRLQEQSRDGGTTPTSTNPSSKRPEG